MPLAVASRGVDDIGIVFSFLCDRVSVCPCSKRKLLELPASKIVAGPINGVKCQILTTIQGLRLGFKTETGTGLHVDTTAHFSS